MRQKRFLKAVVMLCIAGVPFGCGGNVKHESAPQFSERDYALIAKEQSPKAAYFQWKSQADTKPVDDVRIADDRLAIGANPYDAGDAPAVHSGRVIYSAHCASCHGDKADGRGPAMDGQYIKAMDFRAGGKSHAIFFRGGRTPRKWFDRVHDGITSPTPKTNGSPNQMPAFRETLSNEQLWLSLTYLHAVVTGKPAAE